MKFSNNFWGFKSFSVFRKMEFKGSESEKVTKQKLIQLSEVILNDKKLKKNH
jgi:hypothetical protein